MLQQTQALRVVEPYLEFLARFPDVVTLARADASDVLRMWGSLGYNRRALNLWRAARAVADGGGFPRTVDELQALPGVGPYTARAVATFAFDADVGVVDANVRRVLDRCLAPDDVQALADELAPRGWGARWNQAMIDLGAEVCRPRDPRCDVCPVRAMCSWNGVLRPARAAPRFETTSRYARGRIIDALRRGPSTRAGLVRTTQLVQTRVDPALAVLIDDELIHREGKRYALGPNARASASVRRR